MISWMNQHIDEQAIMYTGHRENPSQSIAKEVISAQMPCYDHCHALGLLPCGVQTTNGHLLQLVRLRMIMVAQCHDAVRPRTSANCGNRFAGCIFGCRTGSEQSKSRKKLYFCPKKSTRGTT